MKNTWPYYFAKNNGNLKSADRLNKEEIARYLTKQGAMAKMDIKLNI